jgi:endonuclease G, mitochondrial
MIMTDEHKRRPKLPTDLKRHTEATLLQEPRSGFKSVLKQMEDKRSAQARLSAEAETVGESKPPLITIAEYDSLKVNEKWEILVEALHRNRRRLLRIPGVTAVDLGFKIVDGSFTNELALRVHVERKLPKDSLKSVFKDRPYDFIPKCRKPLPGEAHFTLKDFEVPLDVIEADYKPLQLAELPRPRMVLEKPHEPEDVDRRRRLDPLVGGISIGSPNVPAGTLGALVWDNKDGRVCILSNWHVLSGDLFAEIGTPCFQPGRFDQGTSSDVVARLKRWSFDNQTDAAIAELTGARHYCAGEIVSMFQQISGVVDPFLGMIVRKSGRSTGHTWGFVDGLYFSSALRYSDGVVQVFEDQIHIAPAEPDVQISEAGDSGAVWVTEINGEGYKAVGLHFAGDLPHSAFGEYALANPMKFVQDRLKFSFRPLFLEIRDEDFLSPPPPLFLQAVQSNGNGIHPVGVIAGATLTGAIGQPDPIQVGPNG